MGLDVNLYVEAEITDEYLQLASAYMRSKVEEFVVDDMPALEKEAVDGRTRIVVNTWTRYYGFNYERGPWPEIYGAIRVLQAMFPGYPVYYGPDTTDTGEAVTEAFLEEMWGHFLSPRGRDYYRGRIVE